MRHREYQQDTAVQNLAWVNEHASVLIRGMSHGSCEECDRDVNCNCEHEVRVHWCRRHSALESE